MEDIFVRTRKLSMRQLLEVASWLKEHATGRVSIRQTDPTLFIQQYCAEMDSGKKIHRLKVRFFNETDARRFLMVWG
jgi:hypothetical protein